MSREMRNSGIPWIGDIPKSWRIIRNKNVFTNSKTLVGDAWNKTQLLSLTTKGIKAVAIGSTSGKVPDSYDTYQVVEKDNIVMCLFDLDCSAVFSGLSPIHGMISPAYKALTVKSGFLPDFYAKWFDYIFDGRKFMFLSKNIRYSLTYDEFASLQVVAPSLIEQQNIASFLDRKCAEIDEMIALQEKIVEELKVYKQSVITEAVTKGLNPDVPMKDSGIEWIGDIPEHWENNRLKNLFTLHRGYDLAHEEFVNEGVPVYGSGGFMGYHNEVKVFAPNIIIGRSGSTGKLHYVNEDFWAHNTGIYISDNKGNNIKYLFYVLSVIDMDFLSTKTAVPTLDRKKIQEYFFVYTENHKEQQEISDYLDKRCTEIDNLISIKLSKIDSLKEYKKSIIYEYVTGKKEVE